VLIRIVYCLAREPEEKPSFFERYRRLFRGSSLRTPAVRAPPSLPREPVGWKLWHGSGVTTIPKPFHYLESFRADGKAKRETVLQAFSCRTMCGISVFATSDTSRSAAVFPEFSSARARRPCIVRCGQRVEQTAVCSLPSHCPNRRRAGRRRFKAPAHHDVCLSSR